MVDEFVPAQGGYQAATAGQSARPVSSGRFPALPPGCSSRPETGHGLLQVGLTDQWSSGFGRTGGMTVLAGPSGCGKTTLATAVAQEAYRSGTANVAAWINGASRADVLVGLAGMLRDVAMTDLRSQPELAAERMLAWLARTDRSWLVVIDDVIDPADLRGLLPSGPSGQIVLTCRQTVDVGGFADRGARICQVGPFSPREALGYLTERLSEDTDQRAEALDLAADLGWQPLPLGVAAATMRGTTVSCRDYRQRFAGRKGELLGRLPADQITPVEVAWSLAMDRADQRPPAGLARPVLTLLTLLDPAGVPARVLTSRVVRGGVALAGMDPLITEQHIWAALASLSLVAMADLEQPSPTARIGMHPLLQTAGARLIPGKVLEGAAQIAADALIEAWPELASIPELAQAMRGCAISLHEKTGQALWVPEPHQVLLRVGASLADAGLSRHALSYWQALLATSSQTFGPEHAHVMAVRDQLASATAAAGQLAEAIELLVENVALRERVSGADHPDTLSSRIALANAYRSAGFTDAAIDGFARVLTGREWALGMDAPETIAARGQLAAAFHVAGRNEEAIKLYRRNVADLERRAGAEDGETVAEYINLGRVVQAAGDSEEAIRIFRRVRAVREKTHGPGHPETLTVIASLAYAYRTAGRTKDAVPCYRQALAGREAVLGPDHPDTLASLANLASCYHSAGKLKEAIPLYERVVTDRERNQGLDHRETLTAIGNLASAYESAGRLPEAVPMYERSVAGFERVLGPDHPDTLTCRGNLGHAYYAARRLADAIAIYQRALADSERALGRDHAVTKTMRDNLRAITR